MIIVSMNMSDLLSEAEVSYMVQQTSMDAMKIHFQMHKHSETLGDNSADFLIHKGISIIRQLSMINRNYFQSIDKNTNINLLTTFYFIIMTSPLQNQMYLNKSLHTLGQIDEWKIHVPMEFANQFKKKYQTHLEEFPELIERIIF